MDGFRPDYLERDITPNINYLGKKFSWVCKMFDFADTSFALLYAVWQKSLAPFLRPVNRLENNDVKPFLGSKNSHFQNKAKCKRRILFAWELKQFLYQWLRTSPGFKTEAGVTPKCPTRIWESTSSAET